MERIQKFSDSPLTVCPRCGGELEQLLSAPAIQFKGSGWYVSDYAKKPSGAASAKGNGSASSSTSEGKTESASSESASSKDTSSRETSSKETAASGTDKKTGKK
jgi:putative FmdB family regulatory protein